MLGIVLYPMVRNLSGLIAYTFDFFCESLYIVPSHFLFSILNHRISRHLLVFFIVPDYFLYYLSTFIIIMWHKINCQTHLIVHTYK